MITLNERALKIAIQKPIDRACRKVARRLVEEKLEINKQNLLDEFLAHPISQEIDDGPQANGNILPVEGNLFSFIGFEEGSEPIKDLYQFLEDSIYLGSGIQYDRENFRYTFTIHLPSKEDIKDVTPMPFGTSRSWAFSIESGISGLNKYLSSQLASKRGKRRDLGRSTGGIQLKGVITQGQFRPQKYLSDMLNSFKRSLVK